MSSEAARIHVTVGAKLDEFNKGMGQVSERLSSVGQSVSGAGTTLTKGLTVPVIAAGGAALGLASKYASMGDDIAKTATKLGVSTDALQEMDYWASQNGISSEAMERAVGRLNQRIGLAAEGNDKYSEAFQALGVELETAEGKMRSTEDVMADTIMRLQEVEDPARRSAIAAEVFGTKMARDLMPALEDGSLSLEEAKEKIHELGGVMSGEAIEAAVKYEDSMDDLKRSFSGVWMELANQLIPIITDKLLPAIQDKVIPALSGFASIIGDIISWFQNLSPTMQKVIAVVAGVAVALGPVLLVVGKVISAVGAVIAIAGKLFAGLKVLGAALALIASPIGLVIAAIGALVAGLYYLWNTNEEFRQGVTEIWQGIQEIISVVIATVKEVVTAGLEYLRAFWDKWGDQILGVVEPIWNQIENVINTVVSLISNTIQFFLAVIQGDWKSAWQALLNIGKTIWEFIAKTIENIVTGIKRFLNLAFDMMVEYGRTAFENMRDAIADRIEAVRKAIVDTLQRGIDWIKELPGQAIDWGRDIISGLIDGIRNMAGRVTKAITDVVGGAVDSAKSFLGISSPSRLFKDFGERTGEGYVLGIKNMAKKVKNAVGDMVSPELSVGRSVMSEVEPMGGRNVEGLLRQLINAVKDQDSVLQLEVPEKPGTYTSKISRASKYRGLGGAFR